MATLKQKKAFKAAVKGSTLVGAMVGAGYSKKSAKHTNTLTRTKGWQELLNKHLPDTLLAERHKELLNKREVIKSYNHDSGEYEQEITDQPDTQAVKAALDMGYKLKGHYAAEKKDITSKGERLESSPALVAIAEEFEEKLKKAL